MEEEYQEEIENLKRHCTVQRDELKILGELKGQSAQISELRKQVCVCISYQLVILSAVSVVSSSG